MPLSHHSNLGYEAQNRAYSAAQIKVFTHLDLITQLFLTRFLIFLYVSYSAGKMQAIDTKHIKIGQFV